MGNRWKMNRIGFVNFWLYDEEEFEFLDGKLLLRGQNGSGKSITTQSFIPFILDGDRTPSRLDPFGSSDRKMEYYFLGEEGKEESTGYLFLEFRKEESEEYRSICIGQRAKRGKPMDFWGFVLLDGRRIGYDLKLYKEVGSSKIPLDKREMKQTLGENNLFTDSPSEYKKYVNQQIFGFRKMEQYEQFIRLLVKVRAPKLSKEFKPTKVYEILNDSLQTLTDEDLRPMVDAMEKMDEIQESLDRLNRAFSDVKIIRTEYTRYNQYMLAKKAQAFLTKRQEVEKNGEELRSLEQRKQKLKNDRLADENRLLELSEREKIAQAERSSLLDTDLEEMDRKLERAKRDRGEAVQEEKRWEQKAEEYKEKLRLGDSNLRKLREELEQFHDELWKQTEELKEYQEILQWEGHASTLHILEEERSSDIGDVEQKLNSFKKTVEEGLRSIQEYEEIIRKYDEIAKKLESAQKEKKKKEQNQLRAHQEVQNQTDRWITELFERKKAAKEWNPEEDVMKEAEGQMADCLSLTDAASVFPLVQGLLRKDYERQRQFLIDAKNDVRHREKIQKEVLEEAQKELDLVQAQEELEPERDENAENTRRLLRERGIAAIPFYRTVEFSPELEEQACARLEAQLQKMGILDALVVSENDLGRIRRECPEFLDTILLVSEEGNSAFSKLIVNRELPVDLRRMTARILGNIYEDSGKSQRIYLGKDGSFGQGILIGKAEKAGRAEFVGELARKRRKAEKIAQLQAECDRIGGELIGLEKEGVILENRIAILHQEYLQIPDFSDINRALTEESEAARELQMAIRVYEDWEKQEQECSLRKNQRYQSMLKICKGFPYGRTQEEYQEVYDTISDYRTAFHACEKILIKLESGRTRYQMEEDQYQQNEQAMDDAFLDRRKYRGKVKEFEVTIRQYEEYLNRPEIVEKTKRLEKLRDELEKIQQESKKLNEQINKRTARLEVLEEQEPVLKESYQKAIGQETWLRKYFEEELSLKLVLEDKERDLVLCAQEAIRTLRDNDKNREATELMNALYQVYQRHSGNLAHYGTKMEDCFGDMQEGTPYEEISGMLRKRVRVVSVWNGKKVYLEEFFRILKGAIDETELLIQRKDRELFEDILSQTISRQLTDRIAQSRSWVEDMSLLMKEMDTSMGLCFSLEWKPRKAENDAELDTLELEQILMRDRALLTLEDMEKVASHFRSKIRTEKTRLEEESGVVNYMELVRDALDYRKWFEFRMFFRRGEDVKKPLTNAAFNRYSGGEKAMAMYVPLFAAVNAQYKKAEEFSHPRIIALDEAFAGVDDKNISSMFELVQKLDFDYIMNSQALWGCYETIPGIKIAELLRPMNSQIVTIIRYTWNGHERILDEQ